MIELVRDLADWLPFALPLGLLASWKLRGGWRVVSLVLTLLAAIPSYAHYVEPRILRVKEADIWLDGAPERSGDTLKVLVMSDLHLTDLDYSMPIERIVKRAQGLDFEAVLIAGDLVRSLQPEAIPEAFRALTEFGKPVYVVLGNHDMGRPGRNLSLQLTAYIQSLPNVFILNNRTEILKVDDREVWITGTSDLWSRNIDYPTTQPPPGVARLLLTHNPDVAYDVPENVGYDLLLAGHTHGGQIRIPFIYKRYIPTTYPFDINLYRMPAQAGGKQVWITSGVGMSGVTMRFLIPPRIDIITLHLPDRPPAPVEG